MKVSSPGHHIEGVDKIFSFHDTIIKADTYTLKDGSTSAYSSAVPEDKVWVITGISVMNYTRAATKYEGGPIRDSVRAYVLSDVNGAARYEFSIFVCSLYLKDGDKIVFAVGGGQNGDVIHIRYNGYQMNAP